MTLELEGHLDILKINLHANNEAANKIKNVSGSTVKVKMSKAPNYFERYRNRYSDQATAISDL